MDASRHVLVLAGVIVSVSFVRVLYRQRGLIHRDERRRSGEDLVDQGVAEIRAAAAALRKAAQTGRLKGLGDALDVGMVSAVRSPKG